MNSLHLKALLLAIETGSISAAARKLGKKQPQISQWISDLEIDLGVSFFDRSGNKTSLSKAGEQLLPSLTHTLSQLDMLIQSADMIAQDEPTVLAIGIENYIPEQNFAQALTAILDITSLNIEVYRDEIAQLTQDLRNGDVDIIITHESDTLHHSHFEYCRLGHYQDVLTASPTHPLAQLPVVTTRDLSQYRELILGEVKEHSEGFSPSYATFADIQPLITMLKHSKGFAFLPAEYVNADIKSNQLVTLDCDFEPTSIIRRVELCWRNGLALSIQGEQVVSAFKNKHQLLT